MPERLPTGTDSTLKTANRQQPDIGASGSAHRASDRAMSNGRDTAAARPLDGRRCSRN